MNRTRFVCLLLAAVCVGSLVTGAAAVTVDSDAVYCFTPEDFGNDEEAVLTGICITELPDPQSGTVMLGRRVLQPGDILTAEQVAQMTFTPIRSQEDAQAVISYLPIYEDRVEKSATMTISIRGKENEVPVAEDMALETYKNLPLTGAVKASDPEGEALTYSVTRQGKRGEVVINTDGTFTYTPKKNKVGTDSFTFTATDPAGNVSREATVTIQILKTSDQTQYQDTAGTDCRFEAEWLKNTGIFAAETINGQCCFQPEKTVSRGEFLSMMVQVLELSTEDTQGYAVSAEAPDWMQPYLAAALRSGLISGWPAEESGSFDMNETITGAEAAVAVCSALGLDQSSQLTGAVVTPTDMTVSAPEDPNTVPVWAADAMTAMADNGFHLTDNAPLTRADAALVLYRLATLRNGQN